jgi:hypothetical protein
MELKYALRRLMSEMLSTKISMMGYEQMFINREDMCDFGENVDKEKIRAWFNLHGKYPSESELALLDKMIKGNRIPGVTVRQINEIMGRSERELRERCKAIVSQHRLG